MEIIIKLNQADIEEIIANRYDVSTASVQSAISPPFDGGPTDPKSPGTFTITVKNPNKDSRA